ncbi:MAG: transketolase [Deltaproteobacteria bacterium HGW-Deltaproteobacteria-18]|nr:MAG: transketolase [Deltaproteobacteria bacterium HGW-Deltaproteobacteria-18]
MTTNASPIDTKAVNVIKGLIMDTVRASNSGHPGGAMSSADFAYVLFKEFLNFDPKDPKWFNRDRFVLSAGHESALLYALLTLRGSLSVDDLKAFRQFGSKTPGHPEHDMTDGVEATTGPLGQGFAMAGGMAVAEAFLRDYLDAESAGHFTYALVSDGDVQEPICLGSAALFGHWGLGRLIVYYDSNKIQLAGPTCRADTIDHKALFESMHWQVIEIDGHDHEQIRKAIVAGQAETAKPTLIIGHTTMAKGCATLEGSESTHGSPLPVEEITATKAKLKLPDESFHLPEDVLSHFRARFASLGAARNEWDGLIADRLSNPDFAAKWENATTPVCQRNLTWPDFESGTSVATRKAFGACLGAMMEQLPTLMGGSADLDPSNQTVKFREFAGIFNAVSNAKGRNLCFGVREFPMGAILNGLALHGGIVPFGATFLVFSDYERNAIRMSALQHLPVLHVFTHDSFFVGEDGPTHQPIEHVSSLRLIPNLLVLRPADARESAACMAVALKQKSRPSVLIFTRQGLPVLELPTQLEEHVSKGAYVIRDPQGTAPEMLILASGSEVHLAVEAAEACPELKIRVVSVPSMELFDEQSAQYRESVMPRSITRRVAIEAGRSDLWYKYVGLDGKVWGINHFGASAPAGVLKEEYGFTTANLIKFIKE